MDSRVSNFKDSRLNIVETTNCKMTDYYQFVQDLAEQNKTTGENQSESMIHYTQMNAKRMKRWKKTANIQPEIEDKIKAIAAPQKWTVLTEAWCGDAAHSFMFIQKMADLNDNISFEWKLRDENLDLMDQHLTNGGRSIPKVIVQDENGNDLFNWGPRPVHIQEAYLKMKEDGLDYSDISIELQKMYNSDKGISLQEEFAELIEDSLR